MHYYTYETRAGSFHSGPKVPKHAVCHGRFTSPADANARVRQLRRDYLRSLLDFDGRELAIPERVKLAIWTPSLYQEALARGRKAQAKAKAVTA